MAMRAVNDRQDIRDQHIEHKQHMGEGGNNLPEIRNWKWTDRR
jgi:hypothetical protein